VTVVVLLVIKIFYVQLIQCTCSYGL